MKHSTDKSKLILINFKNSSTNYEIAVPERGDVNFNYETDSGVVAVTGFIDNAWSQTHYVHLHYYWKGYYHFIQGLKI